MFKAVKNHAERGLMAALFFFILAAGSVLVQAEDNPLNIARARTPLAVEKAGAETHDFDVELALTNQQRSLGLMYRAELAPNHGMLFIFAKEQQMRFWMRNCLIPLDIIFLRPDGKIINIIANAEPGTETGRLSDGPAKAVFEIPGGRAAELGLKSGDIVRHALLGNLKARASVSQ